MKISVVIPTYGRPANLLRCLGALARQERAPDEVLVAVREDDCATREALRSYQGSVLPLTIVDAGQADASEARNRCLDIAAGDVLALTDDDTEPWPDWLARVADRFETDASLGALGGPDWYDGLVVPAEKRPAVVGSVQWWGRRVGNHHHGARKTMPVEWLKGANMSFRREALLATRFGRGLRGRAAQFAEDLAVTFDVKRARWKVLYDPAVCVNHFPGNLTAGPDHRSLRDAESLADASHNETVALLSYLSPWRRVVFLIWAALVGTKLLPGAVMAVYLLLTRRQASAFPRAAVIWKGRLDGLRTWRSARGKPRLRWRSEAAWADRPAPRLARVCLVTHVVTPWDGQGRVNYELTRYLLSRGHAVTLVARSVERTLLEEPNLEWIRIPVPAWLPAIVQWGLFALLSRRRLGKAELDRFDIVHLNGAIAPLPADVNTSHFVHASWRRINPTRESRRRPSYQRLVTAVSAYFERRSYASATTVVAVSGAVRGALMEDVGVPAQRTRVIYNGVDAHEFRPRRSGDPRTLRGPLRLAADSMVVLFVGDAKSPRKNLDLALQSLVRLGDQVHLVVVGESRRGPYPALAGRLGVAARTHFLGARHDVADCYRDADVVFCASHYDPASLVVLEAMASGLPVITAPGVGNAPFVVDGANGFVLPSSSDVDSAVEILDDLVRNPDRRDRIGEAARDTSLRVSWERMGREYEELYVELLEDRSRAAARGRTADGPSPLLTSAEQGA